jgi:acyl carrier protein
MNEAQIYTALTDIFRDHFDDEALAVGPTTNAADVPGWDSFNHVQLLVTIEARFGIKFLTTEIEGLKNVGDLARRILVKLAEHR